MLGEGAVGIVYEAEQESPSRSVALKVLRGGPFVSETAVKYLQREAQVLARLRHPGIAVIYELGRTDEGQHFFAMELVRGKTLAAFLHGRAPAASSRAELEFRLALFQKIAEAVSYAHQRGVIHRDLKPSNIMVTLEAATAAPGPGRDAAPDVKILDFGLGRIMDADAAGPTLPPEAGVIVGTLAYMSPEQARGNLDEIDLRSDVYALGVILYEMLTGERPYELEGRSLHDAIHVICETPPRPFAEVADGAATKLDKDLQLIVRTALEKELVRRYQSASALVGDVERFLANQPISARPPRTAYLLKKLVLRHKAAFGGAVAAVVLLAAFAATMTVQAGRIARERERALALSDLLTDTFTFPDPIYGVGEKATVREALERAERTLLTRPRARDVQAEFMGKIGSVYENLGLLDQAIPLLQKSLEIRRQFGDPLSIADGEFRLASSLIEKGAYKQALTHLEDARAIRERKLGAGHPAVIRCTIMLGKLHQDWGQDAEAERCFRSAIDDAAKGVYLESEEGATARNNLGQLLVRTGRGNDAETLLREALQTRERLFGGEDLSVASSLNNLAELYRSQGKTDKAEPLYRRSLEIRKKRLPENHPRLALSLNNLADWLREQKRYAEAEPLYQQALGIFENAVGPEHPFVATVVFNIGLLRLEQGKPREAEPMFRRSLVISETLCKGGCAGSTDIPETRAYLATSLRDQLRLEEAAPMYRQAIRELEQAGEPGRPIRVKVLEDYAHLLHRAGRAAEARQFEDKARALKAPAP